VHTPWTGGSLQAVSVSTSQLCNVITSYAPSQAIEEVEGLCSDIVFRIAPELSLNAFTNVKRAGLYVQRSVAITLSSTEIAGTKRSI
jgi:hypothetical protein